MLNMLCNAAAISSFGRFVLACRASRENSFHSVSANTCVSAHDDDDDDVAMTNNDGYDDDYSDGGDLDADKTTPATLCVVASPIRT